MVNISKVNLFKKDWIDNVFEGRNKEYGAYEMRRRQSRITVWATVIGVLVFSLLMSTPLLISKIEAASGGGRKVIDERVTVVELPPPPDVPKDEIIVPPPPPEIKSIQEVKKFTPPVVAPEEEVVEELVSQIDLKEAIAGSRNIDASEEGDVMIDERPVEHTVEQKITEDRNVYNPRDVQVQAEYPGGINAFKKFVVENMGNLSVDATGNISMQFRFVIEKDGTLTDIRIDSDGGFPDIAKLATNVLSWSPKWQPAVNNGRSVRMAFVLPLTIQIQ